MALTAFATAGNIATGASSSTGSPNIGAQSSKLLLISPQSTIATSSEVSKFVWSTSSICPMSVAAGVGGKIPPRVRARGDGVAGSLYTIDGE